MASTSSTSTSISTFIPQWKYDVFLSFRGEDTRFNFTDHLYANLIRRGIHTFRDDDSLKRGEEIAPELLKAIEESRFSLIVFSENYAGSRWCLDELVKIMKCRKEMKQTVVPIFYHVDPSHVRNQTGRFGEAFSYYKEDTEEMKEKVRSWRSALTEAANTSGEHVKDGYESEHVNEIVNDIFRRLNCRMLDVGDNLVGMNSHVNEIIRKLCVDQLNDVRIIGICGIGGMERGIKGLCDKCLISLSENKILMHDLIQEMGWNIIRSESPGDPTKWSRLWDPSDVCRAFRMGGMKNVEAIFLDLWRSTPLQISTKIFAKMKQLRLLKIYSSGYCGTTEKQLKVTLPEDFQFLAHELRYLHWEGYPLKSLPSNFLGVNLIELNMKDSNIKQLRQRNECLEQLKILNLSRSRQLTEISFSNMPNLEELVLEHCTSLNVVDPSIGDLKNLTTLNLRGCKNLTSLPSSIQYLDSLETFDLDFCSNLEEFPEMKGSPMKALSYLHLRGCGIKELPSSIELLTELQCLNLSNCKNLRSLPSSICRLKSLGILSLNDCSNLDTFPEIMEDMKYLEFLELGGTGIKELPSSIQNLKSLRRLDMSNCLVTLTDSIYNLRSLEDLTLRGCCSNLEKFAKNLEGFCSLERLNLSHCNLMVSIPSGISQLCKLRYLDISHCKMLQDIPELPSSLREIDAHHCTKLEMLSSPSSLLWSSLLKWFNPTSNEHLNCKEGKMILILGNGGIPGWVLHQEIGSQVRIEPPLNCLRLRGDPDEVVDDHDICYLCTCDILNGYASDRLLVTLYPKNAIPNKYHRKQPWHFLAAFDDQAKIIKRCGVQLICTHDYLHDNVPMLLDHQKGHDDAGENQADDQEPHPKRLRASSTDLKL
ncbi:Disease resistance-like protein DSC1 [Vitis vinifera]|uniref:Disease resistance-like protein DSC1 n=1 Tax=Vitis vinifera TaxID=29760 RepID=A0A438HES1_VITVI|nr:Disease resistance-like protein DSC1 [Vitis vinifera]